MNDRPIAEIVKDTPDGLDGAVRRQVDDMFCIKVSAQHGGSVILALATHLVELRTVRATVSAHLRASVCSRAVVIG